MPLTLFRCEIRFVQDIQMGDIGFQIRRNKHLDLRMGRKKISNIVDMICILAYFAIYMTHLLIYDERRKSFVGEGEKYGLLKREKYGWLNTKLL